MRAPDVARFTLTGDLILVPELGRRLAATVGDRNTALMVSHTVVAARREHWPGAAIQQAGDHPVRRSPT